MTTPRTDLPLGQVGITSGGLQLRTVVVSSGTPEGALVADVGSLYYDAAGAVMYTKTSGSGNTGWVALGGIGPGSDVVCNTINCLDVTAAGTVAAATVTAVDGISTTGSCDVSTLTTNTFGVNGANGCASSMNVLSVFGTYTIAPLGSPDATVAKLPVGIVLGATIKITTAVTNDGGGFSLSVGDDTGSGGKWGLFVSPALGTTTTSADFPPASVTMYNGANLVVSAGSGNLTGGALEYVIYYIAQTAIQF